MNDDLGNYLLLLMLGAGAVVLDGQLIRANGRIYLESVHADPAVARSVNRLITALFHLVMLGMAALLSTVSLGLSSPTEIVITKLGVILLVLAAAHGATMFALGRIYARPEERLLREQLTQRIGTSGFGPATTVVRDAVKDNAKDQQARAQS